MAQEYFTKLEEDKRKVLEVLNDEEFISINELVTKAKIGRSRLITILLLLASEGKIKVKDVGRKLVIKKVT